MIENKVNVFYGAKEAAQYLDITLKEFEKYTEGKATLCYKMFFTTRLYSQQELERFKRETLNHKVG